MKRKNRSLKNKPVGWVYYHHTSYFTEKVAYYDVNKLFEALEDAIDSMGINGANVKFRKKTPELKEKLQKFYANMFGEVLA